MALNTLPGGGEPEQQSARVLRAQWQRYQDAYTPVENQLIASLNQDPGREAASDAVDASERSQEATDRIRQRYGMSQVGGDITERQRQLDSTMAGTSAYNTAELARVDRDQEIRQSLVEGGQSLLNQATGGLSDAASMQNQREITGRQNEARAQAREDQQTATLASAGIMAAAAFI